MGRTPQTESVDWLLLKLDGSGGEPAVPPPPPPPFVSARVTVAAMAGGGLGGRSWLYSSSIAR